MVSVTALWMPILLSAVLVFVVSSVIHMLTPLHWNDWRKVPKEDDVQTALRPFNIPPGDYAMPCAGGPAAMREPGFLDKMKKGPVMFMTVFPTGAPSMTNSLVLWFLYSIVVSAFAAYITSRALAATPGADYLQVFRFAGSAAFFCYSMGLPQNSIWYRRSWVTTIKSMFDGLIYGCVTAGCFGWLWPR
jgi:uncharacterized protein (DUF486 family)